MDYRFSVLLLHFYLLLTTSSQAQGEKEKSGKNGNVIDQDFLSDIPTTLEEQTQECKQHCCKLVQDCSDLYRAGERKSGVYRIMINEWRNIDVYCDMETDEGGWTVIQRRGQFDNSEDYFFRNWSEYRDGFGYVDKEFWIGNDHLASLTTRKPYELRVDMKDMEDISAYANYEIFRVENRRNRYKLSVAGYSGTAGDSLDFSNNMIFDTKDQESSEFNCSNTFKGAWWYGIKGCHQANLNGLNQKGTTKTYAVGINWYTWKGHYYSLSFTEMKVRPIDF